MRSWCGMWLFVALLVSAGSASAQLQVAQPWHEFKPDGGRYRVDMPALPKIAIVQVPTGGGASVPMEEATAVVRRVSYIASYVDYPASVTKGAAADVILNQVRKGASTGNTVRDEKKLQLGRSEGREYTVVQANGNVAVTRIYWVRGRLYQLVVDGPATAEKAPETRKFLESFSLITPQ
jgi:hypothetical protein